MVLDASQIPYISTFLFVFAVVFGLLIYSKVGGFDRRINAIIALAIALFSALYEPLVQGMQALMPIAVAVLIVLFFVIFVRKLLEGGDQKDMFPTMMILAILLAVLYLIQEGILALVPAEYRSANILWAAGILIVFMFFWAAYKHPEGGGPPATR